METSYDVETSIPNQRLNWTLAEHRPPVDVVHVYVMRDTAWPLLVMGSVILFMCVVFCFYLCRLKQQGRQQLGYTRVYFKAASHTEKCPVCLDDFKLHQKVARTHCGHLFHCKCLKQWLVAHVTCPLCLTRLNHVMTLQRAEPNEATGLVESV